MRFPEAVRMADGASAPIWERSGKRGGVNIFGLLFFLLAVFGLLLIVLRFTDHSFAAAGQRVDGWVNVPVAKVQKMIGKKDAAPAEAAKVEAPAPAVAPAAPAADATAPAAPAAQAAAPAPAAPAKK